MTLLEFAREADELARKRCDEMNRKRKGLFIAFHHDYSLTQMDYFYKNGYTPESAVAELFSEGPGI